MNVDEMVQQAGERLASRPVAVPSFARLEQAARRRRQAAVGVLTVAVLAATTVGAWAILDGDAGTIRSSESTTAPTPAPTSLSTTPETTADATSVPPDPVVSTATTVAEPVTVQPGSFADIDPDSTVILPPAPIAGRVSPAAVWTGTEMIVWGGSVLLSPSGSAPLSDGAAFDPATGSWRVIAAAPIQGRADSATVWTGSEMLVWGGSAGAQTVADGAAYDPATDTWRTLAPAPIPDVSRPVAAWTGTEMLVVSGMRAVDGGLTPVDDAAAYDPVTDTWRTIASPIGTITAPYPQSTWTGDSLLMVTSETTPKVMTDSTQLPQLQDVVRLIEYRPATDTWTTISDGFNYTFVGVTGVGAAVALPYEADVDGLIIDQRGDVIGSLAGQPSSLTPVPFGQPVWTGSEVLFWGGNAEGVAVNPAAQTWRVFPAGNVANRVDAAVVWADGVMLGWGGFSSNRDGTNVAAADGVMYRPPAPAARPQTTAPTPPVATPVPPDEVTFEALADMAPPLRDIGSLSGKEVDLGHGVSIVLKTDVDEFNSKSDICWIVRENGAETGRLCAGRESVGGMLFGFVPYQSSGRQVAFALVDSSLRILSMADQRPEHVDLGGASAYFVDISSLPVVEGDVRLFSMVVSGPGINAQVQSPVPAMPAGTGL